MNLYSIDFKHYSPKDSESGIKYLLIAENDEQVYEHIASEPKVGNFQLFNSWKDDESIKYNKEKEQFIDPDGDEAERYWWEDENGNPEEFKTRMLRLKGEMYDYDLVVEDAFYGVTFYGWSLLKENINTDYSELIQLGIVQVVEK